MKTILLALSLTVTASLLANETYVNTAIYCNDKEAINKFVVIQNATRKGLVEDSASTELVIDQFANTTGKFEKGVVVFDKEGKEIRYLFVNDDDDKVYLTLIPADRSKDLQFSTKYRGKFRYSNAKGNVGINLGNTFKCRVLF